MHRFAARARSVDDANLGTNGEYRITLDPGVYRPDVVVRPTGGEGEEYTFTAQQVAAEQPDPQPGDPNGEQGQPEAGQPEQGQPEPGQPAAPTQDAPAMLELVVPMSELGSLGGYEVDLELHSGLMDTRVFARNPPLVESRLKRFTSADFSRIYPPEVHDRVTMRDETEGFGSASGEGELWRALAATMLLALLLESLLAWRFGRR